MLVLSVAEYLDKLLKYCRLASVALLCKLGGVVIVTIDLPIVLVVAVLSAKHSGTKGTREMVDVVFPFESRDVGSSESSTTLIAEQAESSEVICLAERVLTLTIFVVGGEEL